MVQLIAEVKIAGLWRRLAALLYDGLILCALLLLATAAVLPLNKGQAFTPQQILFSWYLFTVSIAFFIGFWLHGGQTLGMLAWRIKIQTIKGQPITLWQGIARCLLAIPSWLFFAIGFIWLVIDSDKLTWYDRFSNTRLVIKK